MARVDMASASCRYLVISALRADRGGNACTLKQERESAITFCLPGRCCAEVVKLCLAAM